MKKFGAPFYIILFALTVLVLGMLGLWLWLKQDVFLYLMIALFVVYVIHMAYNMVHGRRQEKREQTTEDLLRAEFKRECVVYLTYFGGEKHVKKPSAHKREYLIEVYAPAVDKALLKRHLWFGLPEAEEKKLALMKRYETKIAYPALSLIEGKTVYLPAGFCEAAKSVPAFDGLLNKNDIVIYGET